MGDHNMYRTSMSVKSPRHIKKIKRNEEQIQLNREVLHKDSRSRKKGKARGKMLILPALLCCGVSSGLLIRTQFPNSQAKWKRKARFSVEWDIVYQHNPGTYSWLQGLIPINSISRLHCL